MPESVSIDHDQLDRIAVAMARANAALYAFADALSEWVNRMIAAMQQFTVALGAWWDVKMHPWLRTHLPHLLSDGGEAAYRRYAARYNARHQGRRISWRRLNRIQREAALAL